MPTFVLNDENVVNCYGFRVRNAGINWSDFDLNPVMLADHRNQTGSVMGNWQNRKTEGSKVLMDSNFDMELPEAKTLSGQVDRKFVKGASMGLAIDFDGLNEPFQKQPDGTWDLVSSTAKEASVCAVPGNSGALALYNKATGELINENEIKLTMAKLSAGQINKPQPMEKITLSTQANSVLVGLNLDANNLTPNEISNALVKLHADHAAEKAAYVALKEKFDKHIILQAEALIDGAIANGQIPSADREEWVELAVQNIALATKQIAKIPGKVSLVNKLNNQTASQDGVKTADDFEKLSADKKLAFKNEHPNEYAKLFAPQV